MKGLYLGAAILGAVVPYFFFFQHIGESGMSLPAFMAAVFANPAASGFTADLLLSSFVFWAFMFHRNRYAHGPSPIGFILLNLFIGLSCALPAYLFAMEVRRSGRTSEGQT